MKYKNPLYPKLFNPTTLSEDYELYVDKDTIRHDTLLMNVTKDASGKLTATRAINNIPCLRMEPDNAPEKHPIMSYSAFALLFKTFQNFLALVIYSFISFKWASL